VLEAGELITAIEVPASALARRSHYLKLRERASYEFALVSAAVALDLDGPDIRAARIALGGVAPKPWRLGEAEVALRGISVEDEPAAWRILDASFTDARPRRHNGFKIELAKRALIRALQSAGGMA
jgi:xanthine dehydrogenase YagS FAD-binding subunit